MLGCKYLLESGLSGKMCELIDTCWDVNTSIVAPLAVVIWN